MKDCCRDVSMSSELKQLRQDTLQKLTSVPFDAVQGLAAKVAALIGNLPTDDPRVNEAVAQFLEVDMEGWITTFQLDSQIATDIFERAWSRQE